MNALEQLLALILELGTPVVLQLLAKGAAGTVHAARVASILPADLPTDDVGKTLDAELGTSPPATVPSGP